MSKPVKLLQSLGTNAVTVFIGSILYGLLLQRQRENLAPQVDRKLILLKGHVISHGRPYDKTK